MASNAPEEQNHSLTNNDIPNFLPNAPKKKSSKHKFNILGRKGSVRDEELQAVDSRTMKHQNQRSRLNRESTLPPKFSSLRNNSSDPQGTDDSFLQQQVTIGHGSLKSDIRNTGSRAADGFGRAAKGLFGKLSTRSLDSKQDSIDRALRAAQADEAQKAAQTKNYRVVNLPLEEQTRRTRICKRLEDCKDKTEFWLPAVAYRCIDYLNDKGMAHEGLYRVPGSEREIRNWIYRFDTGLFSLERH